MFQAVKYPPISIHAPRVGSDYDKPFVSDLGSISIHAPRVGSDSWSDCRHPSETVFQSTLPVWGATGAGAVEVVADYRISIHAPRVGSDPLVF